MTRGRYSSIGNKLSLVYFIYNIQSSYWERLVRSHYMMVIQASERMSNVDRSNSNSGKIIYTM